MTKKITWKTKQIRLGDLEEWSSNPVYLTEKDADQIRRSVEKFGIVAPLVANKPGEDGLHRLIDGHQRKAVMFYSKIADADTLVDVRVPSRRLTGKECDELSIRLRKNTGDWDMEILANDFDVEDLLDWGFEERELGMSDPIDYEEMWKGMPEFEQEDQGAMKTVMVHFRTQKDVDAFAEMVDQTVSEKTKSIWFPKKEREDFLSIAYVDDKEADE